MRVADPDVLCCYLYGSGDPDGLDGLVVAVVRKCVRACVCGRGDHRSRGASTYETTRVTVVDVQYVCGAGVLECLWRIIVAGV